MIQHNTSPHAGYSIIMSLMMIGFLLVLTTGTLNLVLQEMQDGKGKQDYMKSSAAAEGALELALLDIKEKGYGYDTQKENLPLLGDSLADATLSYALNTKVSVYSGSVDAYATDIIPLFWIDDTSTHSLSDQSDLRLTAGADISWNIIGSESGISGTGSFDASTEVGEKTLSTLSGNPDFAFVIHQTISGFLRTNSGAYIMIYNPSASPLSYTLQSHGNESFSQPRMLIQSAAKVGKYTQNLETMVDNTEFLGILKYSIYSGE